MAVIRTRPRRALPALLALAAAPLPAQPKVTYDGRRHAADALPEAVPEATREVVALWAPLIDSAKLRCHVGADGAFVLFTARGLRRARSLPRAARRVTEHFAEVWGRPEDAAPYAVFVVREQSEVTAILDHVVAKYPYLSPWARSARDAPGFNLYDPPVYVILDDPGPEHEFRLANQLIHQQTLLILYTEFRTLPFWLREGIAWTVEEDLTRAIYAFNTRAGFVGKKEHRGWRKAVRAVAAARGDLGGVFDNRRDRHDREAALLSYGFARFLLHEGADTARATLRALGDAHWKKSEQGKDPTVELTPEEQLGVLRARLGADFERRALDYLAGKR